MKRKELLKAVAIMFFTLMPQAQASSHDGATNDLPSLVWICRDNVADGGKNFVIARDQFGVYSAQLIQKDQILGDSILATFLDVQVLQGGADLTAVHRFGAVDLEAGNMFNFFVNVIPNARIQDAHLRYISGDELLVLDLRCQTR